eukprot:COSAG04_NODE_2265_length_4421_cov_18.722119_1_plen_148_part_10
MAGTALAAFTAEGGRHASDLELDREHRLALLGLRPALRDQELRGMKLGALSRHALDVGVGEDALAGAQDENEPKEAVLALVLAQRKPPAEDEPDRQADGGEIRAGPAEFMAELKHRLATPDTQRAPAPRAPWAPAQAAPGAAAALPAS